MRPSACWDSSFALSSIISRFPFDSFTSPSASGPDAQCRTLPHTAVRLCHAAGCLDIDNDDDNHVVLLVNDGMPSARTTAATFTTGLPGDCSLDRLANNDRHAPRGCIIFQTSAGSESPQNVLLPCLPSIQFNFSNSKKLLSPELDSLNAALAQLEQPRHTVQGCEVNNSWTFEPT
mmetsp:Transcript_71471/g.149401  ORF Transcript_71471/g.149401 Transcript_71471/m.149401 type:complete len:176 (+) Transcript_71471:841-1368(+)